MKLNISEQAANWYKNEFRDTKTTYVRFFPRYGGVGGLIPGFSIGINFDEPENMLVSFKANGIVFFIEQSDAWYFEGKDELTISFDETINEPKFNYS